MVGCFFVCVVLCCLLVRLGLEVCVLVGCADYVVYVVVPYWFPLGFTCGVWWLNCLGGVQCWLIMVVDLGLLGCCLWFLVCGLLRCLVWLGVVRLILF